MLNLFAKFHEYRTCSFREITTIVTTNERTNQPTNKHAEVIKRHSSLIALVDEETATAMSYDKRLWYRIV